MNRALSIRSRKKDDHAKEASKHTFSISTLRGIQQAELSKKLYKLIKTENHAIGAYETAGRERLSIASQLSDWGESTNDDSVSDISDKIGVILSEIGEQEDLFAQNLEDYRAILKQIRNIESSVQPSRDQKTKISDEIQRLKYKEPSSPKLVTLEQELVRAEAQNLVAEAQLTNIVSYFISRPAGKGLARNANTHDIDAPEGQGSVRSPLRGDHRASRETDHSGQVWPPPAELARRHPCRAGRRAPALRAGQ
jgi:hypothetical protein